MDIVPTYLSVDSFLESAKFKLTNSYGNDQNVHGGFQGQQSAVKDSQVALGVGRENINGLLPVYLFKEHWWIAKRKMQPLLGFMCTLDVLGYSSEQYFTVPFTVLVTALQKVEEDPTEINKKMLNQVLLTCQNIIKTAKTFRNELVKKIIDFSTLKPETSTRT